MCCEAVTQRERSFSESTSRERTAPEKARLVARGDRQSRMPDEDNYASTVLPVVTRMLGVINLSLTALLLSR